MAGFETLAGSAPRRGQPPPAPLTAQQREELRRKATRAEDIAVARRQGHSDDAIAAAIAAKNPEVKAALDNGYPASEVLGASVAVHSLGSQDLNIYHTNNNTQHIETGARSRDYKANEAANPVGLGAHIAADYKAGGGMSDAMNASANPLAIALRASPGVQGGAQVLDALGGAANVVNEGLTRQYRRGGGTESGASNIKDSLNLFESFIPVGDVATGAKVLAGTLKGGARVIAPAATDVGRLVKGLMTPLTEEQKFQRAVAGARPSAVRPETRKLAEALRDRVRNESAAAERAANAQEKALGDAQRLQATQVAAAEANPVLGVGELQPKSVRGADVRQAADVPHETIIQEQRANDARLRDMQREISDAEQATGKSVADLPDAQAMLKSSEEALSRPGPQNRDVTSAVPVEASRVHSEVVNALRDRRVAVSHDEALAAQAAGDKVDVIPPIEPGGEPTYMRTFKTSFEALDNLRRRFGQAFANDLQGFTAETGVLRRNLSRQIDNLQTQFVGEVHPQLQSNWSEGLRARAPYEETKLGRAITDRQDATLANGEGIVATTANKLPDRIIGGGRDALVEYRDKTSAPDALRFMRNELEAAFENKTYADIAKDMAANGKIRDAIDALPQVLGSDGAALRAEVERHVQNLLDAEMAGTRAGSMAGRSTPGAVSPSAPGPRLPKIGDLETNRASALAARDAASALEAQANVWAAQLERAGPKEATEIGLKVVEARRAAGYMTTDEAKKASDWLVKAGRNHASAERLKKWIGSLLAVGAVGSLGASGYLVAKGGQAANKTANLLEP